MGGEQANGTNDKRKREVALERVTGFVQDHGEHGEPYLALACHAALPFALSPELVYQLWAKFTPEAPWTAVADLLLSRLCQEAGHELYAMDAGVRDVLLQELDASYGANRMAELSDFVRQYFARQLDSDDPDEKAFAQSQHWTALAYADAGAAANVLLSEAQRLQDSDHPDALAEAMQMYTLIDTLSAPLAQYRTQLLNALPHAFHTSMRQTVAPSGPVEVTQRYINFDLDIRRIDPDSNQAAQVAQDQATSWYIGLSAPAANDASVTSRVEMRDLYPLRNPLELQNRLLGMQSGPEALALGNELGTLLFPPPIRELFEQQRAALGEHDVLRIRLRSDDYGALSLPWELCSLSPSDSSDNGDFLLSDPRISFVRHATQPVANDLSPTAGHPLKVLALLFGQTGDPIVNVEAEWHTLQRSLSALPDVELSAITDPTQNQLTEALSQPVHVVHLIGARLREQLDAPPAILLNGPDGPGGYRSLSGDVWTRSGTRLLVANSNTSAEDANGIWPWLRLIETAVPAVLHVPAEMNDTAAAQFCEALYIALIDGFPVDAAVAQGRRAVLHQGSEANLDWTLPALYASGEMARFPRPATPPPQPAEPVEPLPQPATPPTPVTVVVDESAAFPGLHLRAEPNIEAPTIATLSPGTRLELLDPSSVIDAGSAGKWLNVRAPDGLSGFVAAQFVRLSEPHPEPEPSTSERDTLTALSLFPIRASRQALTAVAGAENGPEQVNASIDRLRAQSLIEQAEADWLALTGPAREQALAQLSSDPALANVLRHRFVAYYAQFAQTAAASAPEQTQSVNDERDNLLAALDMAEQQEAWPNLVRIGQAVCAYSSVLFSPEATEEAVRRFDQAIRAAERAGDHNQMARFLVEKGAHLMLREQTERAIEPLQQAIEVCRLAGDRRAEAGALRNLGFAYSQMRDPKRAIESYEQALKISQEINDQRAIADALLGLANARAQMGDLEGALASAEQAMSIKTEINTADVGDTRALVASLREQAQVQLANDPAIIVRVEVAYEGHVEMFELPNGTHWIGHSSKHDPPALPLPDPNGFISRRHARIVLDGTTWTVTDTSVNGTQLNGKPLRNGQPYRLKDGDVLMIEGRTLTFRRATDRQESTLPFTLSATLPQSVVVGEVFEVTVTLLVPSEQKAVEIESDVIQSANIAQQPAIPTKPAEPLDRAPQFGDTYHVGIVSADCEVQTEPYALSRQALLDTALRGSSPTLQFMLMARKAGRLAMTIEIRAADGTVLASSQHRTRAVRGRRQSQQRAK